MTIHVRNWERHQHRDFAKRKSQTWFRLDAAIFDDPKVAELNAGEFRAWIKLLTLAARTGNEIPSTANYLRAHLGRNWQQFCHRFAALSLLDAPDLPKKDLEKATMTRGSSAQKPHKTQETHTQEPKSGPPRAVLEDAKPLDLEALEAWDEKNVVDIDTRRRVPPPSVQGEANGRPLDKVVGDVLDDLRARAQSP